MSDDNGRCHTPSGVLAAIVIIVAAIALMPRQSRALRVVYNASGSAPIGWYRIEHGAPGRGDLVLFTPSPPLESMLVTHGILRPGIPLMKRVVAIAGDSVCRFGRGVSINGEALAEAMERDQNGRPLPVWEGCFTLLPGQFFVVQEHRFSFDSRYFGPVSECQIIGVAHPIWTWKPGD
jgi:conjugative transfer signal peptidase TraF